MEDDGLVWFRQDHIKQIIPIYDSTYCVLPQVWTNFSKHPLSVLGVEADSDASNIMLVCIKFSVQTKPHRTTLYVVRGPCVFRIRWRLL